MRRQEKPFERRTRSLRGRQYGRQRTSSGDVRVRRSSAQDGQFSLQYNQDQFANDDKGRTYLKVDQTERYRWQTLPMHGHYTGPNSPTLTTDNGSLVLQLAVDDVMYFTWHRSEYVRKDRNIMLHLHTWAGTDTVTDIKFRAEAWFHRHGVALTETAQQTVAAKASALIDGLPYGFSFDFQDPPQAYDEIHWRVTVAAATFAAGAKLFLGSAGVRYVENYTHQHG